MKRSQTSVIPDLPNQETNITDLNFAPAQAPTKPALTISTGAATVAAPKLPSAAAQQDNAPPVVGGGENTQTIIALSATPGPAAPPVPIPAGNLSANISISPDGTRPGVPGGAENGGSSNGGAGGGSASPGGAGGGNGNGGPAIVPGITVSGGSPSGKTGISGLGGGSPRIGVGRRSTNATPGMTASSDTAKSSGKPSDIPVADRVAPGAPPEHIFGTRTFYSLNVNMPNISSVSGSWILKFAELDDPGDPAIERERAKTLTGPVPLRKVDPRYPQDQVRSHIQGEVVLYALIREDGSVDSIQVVRSLDPALDKSAMEALAEWKFTPASRNGTPLPLEAIVHIPFHYVRPNY